MNTFIFYFDKAVGEIDIKKFLQKSIKDCAAKVIIDDKKPALLTYNCKKHLFTLRTLTGEKHPKIRFQRLRQIRIRTFGSMVHQIYSFKSSKTETNFPKN